MRIDIEGIEALAKHGAYVTPGAILALVDRLRESERREQALLAQLDKPRIKIISDLVRAGIDPEDVATSLAQRDARVAADAIEEALDALNYMAREVGSNRGAIDATRDELRSRLHDCRQQAAGGES